MQWRNASPSIILILGGRVIFSIPQSAKAVAPIVSITAFSSKVTSFNILQFLNARAEIVFTDLGTAKEVRFVSPSKQFPPIDVKALLPSNVTFFNKLHPAKVKLWKVVIWLPSATITSSILEYVNVWAPRVVIDFGNLTLLSPELLKESLPVEIKPSGKSKAVRA